MKLIISNKIATDSTCDSYDGFSNFHLVLNKFEIRLVNLISGRDLILEKQISYLKGSLYTVLIIPILVNGLRARVKRKKKKKTPTSANPEENWVYIQLSPFYNPSASSDFPLSKFYIYSYIHELLYTRNKK